MQLRTLMVQLAVMLVMPILVVGVINRTKAMWAGRRGPPLLQTLFDLKRLLHKQPVYSQTTTSIFKLGPLVLLASALVAALIAPITGAAGPVSFAFDFVAFASLWGLGRVFMMLAALDTGSAFEGMGASREATYAALLEPGLFMALGTLAGGAGHTSFAQLLDVAPRSAGEVLITALCVVCLLVVLQVEGARVPVDDPATHLELTMIHEVMVLDHSGVDLAVIQFASALKLMVCAALVATLINPFHGASASWLALGVNLGLTLAVAVLVGTSESLVARLRLRILPRYVLVALTSGFLALLVSAARYGSGAAP